MDFKQGKKILIKYTKEKAFTFEKGEILIIFYLLPIRKIKTHLSHILSSPISNWLLMSTGKFPAFLSYYN